MSLNLPAVISTVSSASLVSDEKSSALAPTLSNVKIDKQIVFCITHDIPDDAMENLKRYGKVLEYNHDVHNNIPLESMDFDYLVLDQREKGDRYAYLKYVKPAEHKYSVILYCYAFEVEDLESVEHYDVSMCQFPERQAHKHDYDLLMLSERLTKPRWYLSLFKCLYSAYSTAK